MYKNAKANPKKVIKNKPKNTKIISGGNAKSDEDIIKKETIIIAESPKPKIVKVFVSAIFRKRLPDDPKTRMPRTSWCGCLDGIVDLNENYLDITKIRNIIYAQWAADMIKKGTKSDDLCEIITHIISFNRL